MVAPMPAPTPQPAGARRRRLAPDDRREEILDAARHLFAQRPYASVTTAEIAEAAGVARSLVHHYFGGIRGVFLAVLADGAAALTEARTAGPDVPFLERTAHNIAASLDVIANHQETWLAVLGHAADPSDTDIHALVLAARRRGVDVTLNANRDIVRDTPSARFALGCFTEFTIEAVRCWLLGERTREDTEALLLTAGRNLLTVVIPGLPGQTAPDGD
jgi:AcrR family transcriptional regulator